MIFNHLEDFIAYHNICPICDSTLEVYLRAGYPDRDRKIKSFREFNAKLTDHAFVFKMDYTSPYATLHGTGKVNTLTNEFTFQPEDMSVYDNHVVIDVFDNFAARLEAVCSNTKCEQNYYVLSHVLKLGTWGILNENGLLVSPTGPDVEFLNIPPHLCVMNDLRLNRTYIYNVNSNDDVTPLMIPLMKFTSEDKNKQFNRIKTIVNFG